MAKEPPKITVPKDIQDELYLFYSRNYKYDKTIIPINLIDSFQTKNELYCLFTFISFKLSHSTELGLDGTEIETLIKGRKALEDSIKDEPWVKESIHAAKNMNKVVASYSYKKVLALFMESLLEYVKLTITTLEYIKTQRKSINSEASKNIDFYNNEERNNLLQRLNKQNEELSYKEIFNAYIGPSSLLIYSYALAIRDKMDDFSGESKKLISLLFQQIDQQIYYTFVLLNCQKLCLQYERNLYTFLLSPNTDELDDKMTKLEYSSTIKMYYILKIYEEIFSKHMTTVSSIYPLINKIIEENQ